MTPHFENEQVALYLGDAREVLNDLPNESVNCVVTSPPYWGLRDYGHAGQLGLEPTPEAYVANLVAVFREVRRVLRSDGTAWLNLGDSYARTGGTDRKVSATAMVGSTRNTIQQRGDRTQKAPAGIKEKDLVGIPWRVAFALQADGWYLRSDIIWAKTNPMPESVTDRPTRAHEYVFLLTKSPRYYYDADAVREMPASYKRRGGHATSTAGGATTNGVGSRSLHQMSPKGRNRRTVWAIPTRAHRGAHFAVFPTALVEPCIKAGSPLGGTVLDPFAGSGTVGQVSLALGRRVLLIEVNPEYAPLILDRIGAA